MHFGTVAVEEEEIVVEVRLLVQMTIAEENPQNLAVLVPANGLVRKTANRQGTDELRRVADGEGV